ncbi:hypothetical protein QZN11_36295 [Streptomyces gramineus]|uniref:hypothetical protein n=1 Tax=Streptomyces gramineus TaxID=910542 RepID=UPI00398B6FFE
MAKIPEESDGPQPPTTAKPPASPPTTTPSGPWTGGTDVPHVRGGIHNSHPFTPPPVPGGEGGKGTSVDTPSMDRFAENIDRMIQPVKDAQARLAAVAVAPGAFYHANAMRVKINGPNADSGLKKSYTDALTALVKGLTDTRDGARKLSHDYGAGEDANKVTAKNLADAFAHAPGDFNSMMTANGGSAAPAAGSSGSGSGGSSGGSGGSGGGGSNSKGGGS